VTGEAGSRRAAIAAEQAHLDRVIARVDGLRAQAEGRLAEVRGERLGSTFSAQFERDVLTHHQAGRVARFTFGDRESLLFGRLDLADGDSLPIGRLSVMDDEGPLLVDWRAPAAAPFYRATAAQPEGVARRRTILAEGPAVLDVADELIDAAAADRLSLEATTGQGALLAALERTHDHAMRDIVATIQQDQDRIIRAPATGTLIVTGGPGTGKTVVALHRVAFLLYADRERFENRGVLVVGPSRTFTEYTRRVLPSLGEDRVVQRSLESLGPVGVDVVGWDVPSIAGLKGRSAMAEACRAMVEAALPPLPPVTRFTVAGTSAEVAGRDLARLRRRLFARVDAARPAGRYHARSGSVQDQLIQALRNAWEEQRGRLATSSGELSAQDFEEIVLEAPEVRMLLRCFWPVLAPEEVLGEYARARRRLADVAGGALSSEECGLVHSAWLAADGWTFEDAALLDEIEAILGPTRPSPTRNEEDDRPQPPDVTDHWYADFAHIVVDEAQDLSAMQWRAIVRRGPFASWTVVGDLAQRARATEPDSWEQIAAAIGRRTVVIETLSTNYRTPSELAPIARHALGLAGHAPDAFPLTVRSNGRAPVLVVSSDPIAAGIAHALRGMVDTDGTLALIVPGSRVEEIRARLLKDAGTGRASDVRVLDPRRSKGLEFDDVVIVAPEEIVTASPLGAHDLYVALTRATRSLTLVTAQRDLPALAVPSLTWASSTPAGDGAPR